MNLLEAEELIRNRLSDRRYRHSLQVASVARDMARDMGVDEDQAYLAGIVHDYAKGMSGGELLALAERHCLVEDEVERLAPDLLHAEVGAYLLATEHGVTDTQVLDAVRNHTLGRIGMSELEKIIFLADMIEPGRDFPGIERLRCVARRDLDQGMILAIESTLRYCMERRSLIHPRTVLVRNYILAALPRDKILW